MNRGAPFVCGRTKAPGGGAFAVSGPGLATTCDQAQKPKAPRQQGQARRQRHGRDRARAVIDRGDAGDIGEDDPRHPVDAAIRPSEEAPKPIAQDQRRRLEPVVRAAVMACVIGVGGMAGQDRDGGRPSPFRSDALMALTQGVLYGKVPVLLKMPRPALSELAEVWGPCQCFGTKRQGAVVVVRPTEILRAETAETVRHAAATPSMKVLNRLISILFTERPEIGRSVRRLLGEEASIKENPCFRGYLGKFIMNGTRLPFGGRFYSIVSCIAICPATQAIISLVAVSLTSGWSRSTRSMSQRSRVR